MKKLNDMVEAAGDMVLKYQVIPDELDALVTVKSDEDLKHMVDEYRRLESEGTSKLRAFLFHRSPTPVVVVDQDQMNYPVYPLAIEQRYIEAVNGITRSRPISSNTSGRLTPVNVNRRPIFSISACSSPASPEDAKTVDSLPLLEPVLPLTSSNRVSLPKVQSSPSLYSLSSSSTHHQSHQVNYHQPHYLNNYHQNHHHHHQQLQAAAPGHSFQTPKPTHDFRTEKSPGPPHDFGRVPMGHGHGPAAAANHVHSIGKHNLGNGYCYYDEFMVHPSGGLIRRGSVSTSGRLDRPGSPRNHMWE